MGWVSPTSHNDPSNKWGRAGYEEEKVYDGNTNTFVKTSLPDPPPQTWTGFLELLHSAIICSKIRINAYTEAGDKFDIDVYYDGGWHNVYEGAVSSHEWVEKDIPEGTQTVTQAQFRFFNGHGAAFPGQVYEFAFWEVVIVAPTVTTQAVSSIGTTTATGNGNITDTGGEGASAWGVCVAETENPDTGDTVFAGSGSGGAGAFTASMTSLSQATHYYARAYATNSEGTSYGSQVEFYTVNPKTSSDTGSGAGTLTAVGLFGSDVGYCGEVLEG